MSTQKEVFDFITNIIIDMKDLEADEITSDTPIDELGFDSLDYVEIQVHVKREYFVTLTPSLFEARVKTVGQLCAYIADASATQEV